MLTQRVVPFKDMLEVTLCMAVHLSGGQQRKQVAPDLQIWKLNFICSGLSCRVVNSLFDSSYSIPWYATGDSTLLTCNSTQVHSNDLSLLTCFNFYLSGYKAPMGFPLYYCFFQMGIFSLMFKISLKIAHWLKTHSKLHFQATVYCISFFWNKQVAYEAQLNWFMTSF